MKEFFNSLSADGKWQSLVVAYSVKILIAILILVVGFWLINRLVKLSNNYFASKHIENTVAVFFKTAIGTILKILLVFFALNLIGVKTTSVVAIFGAAGLAVGLALQGTLTNFAGGVLLLLFKPFRHGDTIEAQGKKGTVQEIQIFTTVLMSPENKKIIIPNSVLSNGIIEVYLENTVTTDKLQSTK